MEENNKITKIVVNSEDELTDIVSGIQNAKTEKIILTFAEESDILISPINLAVIKETADEIEKILVCQIIKNPTGLRNSKMAGIITIDTPNNPTEDTWAEAKRVEEPVVETTKSVPEHPMEKNTLSAGDHKNSTDFEKRINQAILKNRSEMEKRKENKTINQDGLVISLDEDLPSSTDEFVSKPDLSKIDFHDTGERKSPFTFKMPKLKLPSFLKKKDTGPEIPSNAPVLIKKLRRYWPIYLISALLVTILVGVIYYTTVPFVKVRIFVKAQEVSLEKTFVGDTNIKEIDFENYKIPVKAESIEESRSTTITATGKAYKGEKATGNVTLTHPGPTESCTKLSLSAGQVVISSDGKTYALDSATDLACNSYVTAAVHATDIGEEYNTSSTYFTVQNYSSSEAFGYRSGTFSGGSKEEYTVLSLSDVNTAAEELKKTTTDEAEQKLRAKEGEWTLIADSVKSEVKKDSQKTDVAIGAAATQANLSLTVTSTGTFYYNQGFDDGVATLLTTEAQSKNLFESTSNLELTLGDDIKKEITVVQSTADSFSIKLVATGSVQPKIDKEQITNTLKTMNWKEGSTYLDSIKYSDKNTLYEFNPVNFPKFLYHFPSRQGGIMIDVVDI